MAEELENEITPEDMNDQTDESLFELSDEELEKAFETAKAGDIEIESEAAESNNNDVEEENDDEELEEPEEESDEDEAESEEEVEDSEDEPDTAEDEKSTDAEPEESEEQPKEKETQSEVKKYKYKANGQEFEFTEDEIKEQFGRVFAQSMNYTKKMQAIAPYRKMISAIEEEGLTQDDMNLMIDALKGNKEAIATVLKKANVDALDIDLDSVNNYKPKEYGKNETELAVKEVIDEIKTDPEYEVTSQVIAQRWDDSSRQVFAEKPELIKELHVDIKTGVFDKVSPIAAKLKVYDGGRRSDLEYYVEAGRQYYADLERQKQQMAELSVLEAKKAAEQAEAERLAKVKAENAKRAAVKQASKKRKAAATTKSRAGKKVTSYLDDSDEAFEEWYKALQERM